MSVKKITTKFSPAKTPEAREKQLISLAMDRAEQQIRDGTASSQVITHFLKLGSEREHKEMEMLREKTELLKAKTEQTRAAKNIEELYNNATNAVKVYRGEDIDDEDL